jgi:hypothetical protein
MFYGRVYRGGYKFRGGKDCGGGKMKTAREQIYSERISKTEVHIVQFVLKNAKKRRNINSVASYLVPA